MWYVLACVNQSLYEEQEAKFLDADQDGFSIDAGDCDDQNDLVFPDAPEWCDGVDNNCDGEIDESSLYSTEWYFDADEDGFGGDEIRKTCRQPDGYVSETGDCDDTDARVFPGGTETLLDLGWDNNCNGEEDTLAVPFADGITLRPADRAVYVPNLAFEGAALVTASTDMLAIHREYGVQPEILTPFDETLFWANMYVHGEYNLWMELQEYGSSRAQICDISQFDQHVRCLKAPQESVVSVFALEPFIGREERMDAIFFSHQGYEAVVVHDPQMQESDLLALPPIIEQEGLRAIAAAPDSNGDGYAEIVLEDDAGIKVLLGNMNGDMDQILWQLAYPEGCRQMDVVDFDGDENVDFVCMGTALRVYNHIAQGGTSDVYAADYRFQSDGDLLSFRSEEELLFVLEAVTEQRVHLLTAESDMRLGSHNSYVYSEPLPSVQLFVLPDWNNSSAHEMMILDVAEGFGKLQDFAYYGR
ncbi:MAG: putative metal-binding motif-containing protein [Myxococcota bacterium]|nr:putative metal-binding motif-containing protein [Myxococcota bacterium]